MAKCVRGRSPVLARRARAATTRPARQLRRLRHSPEARSRRRGDPRQCPLRLPQIEDDLSWRGTVRPITSASGRLPIPPCLGAPHDAPALRLRSASAEPTARRPYARRRRIGRRAALPARRPYRRLISRWVAPLAASVAGANDEGTGYRLLRVLRDAEVLLFVGRFLTVFPAFRRGSGAGFSTASTCTKVPPWYISARGSPGFSRASTSAA